MAVAEHTDRHFACPYSFNGRKAGLPIRELR
jgi:hypothetical protein